MLTRLNFIRRGYSLTQVILIKFRPIHFTSCLRRIKDEESSTMKTPSSTTASQSPSPSISTRSHLTASEISEHILKRLHFREQRGVVKALIIGSGIVFISTVLFLYVFRKPLKNQTVAQVADVAKSSLEHDSVKQQVNALSLELIQNLLTDSNILTKALVFLERIMDDPATKQTLIRLLQRLMIDPEMQQNVSEFTSRIIYDVMKKPETEIQLAQLFRRAILQKDNQDALYILLKQFIDDKKTRQLLTNLALEVSHQVLHDENVKIAATLFVKDILNDSSLQQQSGDFAWNAVKEALKPKWFTNQNKPLTIDQDRRSNEVRIASDFESSIILPSDDRSE